MRYLSASILMACLATACFAQAPSPDAGRIAGRVHFEQGAAEGVTVILCDGDTGIPLVAGTLQPLHEAERNEPREIATTISDKRGRFEFEGLPPGVYRVVAQKWTGAYKGLFELHGSVIQLFGSADRIEVPSEEAQGIDLRPPGAGVLQFNQEVGNNETLLVLSTQPPVGDPILGFYGWGDRFLTNAIGVNRMPYGWTTVVGLPPGKVYATFFAADNSPGFAAGVYEVSKPAVAPRAPFVAGWSDARKEPPPQIARIMTILPAERMEVLALLGDTGGLPDRPRIGQILERTGPLDRQVALPNGEQASVADVLAALAYRELAKLEK